MLYEPYGKHNIFKKSQVQLSEVKSLHTFKIYLSIELIRTGTMARHDNICFPLTMKQAYVSGSRQWVIRIELNIIWNRMSDYMCYQYRRFHIFDRPGTSFINRDWLKPTSVLGYKYFGIQVIKLHTLSNIFKFIEALCKSICHRRGLKSFSLHTPKL